MNYVKHLSLALLVIGASSLAFAQSGSLKPVTKAANLVEEGADKAKKTAEDVKDGAEAVKDGAEAVKDADKKDVVAFTSNPWKWFRAQRTSTQALIGAGVAGSAFAAAYYLNDGVKQATHKAIAKVKAFANEAIENPEGSSARLQAIGLIAAAGVAGAVYYKWDAVKGLVKKDDKKADENKDAKKDDKKADKDAHADEADEEEASK